MGGKTVETLYPVGVRRPLKIKDSNLQEVLEGKRFLLVDGAMGTSLQAHGMPAGAIPELFNLTDPDTITSIHTSFVEAGAEVITTNTFGANAQKLAGRASVREVFQAAVACAQKSGAHYIAADIGPIGSLLEPMGAMKFEEAYDLFTEEVRAATDAGANLILIETMADLKEAKSALLAAKENSDLPVLVTMTFEEDGRTFLGTTPEVAAVTLQALGANAVGINCSLGPAKTAGLLDQMIPYLDAPVMVQPNAGLPTVKDGKTTYDVDAATFAHDMEQMVKHGASIIGACCGSTPAYTAKEKELLERYKSPQPHEHNHDLTLASAQTLFSLPEGHIGVIGERINPTGKKKVKAALRDNELDYLLTLAIQQEKDGAQVLDINVGLPEVDEVKTLKRTVDAIGTVSSLPVQVDSSNSKAVETVVRSYAGKPLINSTNGRRDIMDQVIPIAAHYGCALVCLTLDENGIPNTVGGRLAIVNKIYRRAQEYHIPPQDLVFDCLALTASTDQSAPRTILDSIRAIKQELPGVRTVLGVSNISFGLPYRSLVNATFLSAAFAAGLDLAIVNPGQQRIHDAIDAWRVLSGEDRAAQHYCTVNATRTDAKPQAQTATASSQETADIDESDPEKAIYQLVLQGREGPIPELTKKLIQEHDPLYPIDHVLIPALNDVGDRFERGTFFLPQLMASAQAAKAGFNTIRDSQPSNKAPLKGKIVLCTVKGDIHDMGKNILKMLMENYGYQVIDLGRDVEPEQVVEAVKKDHVQLCGLSALMTTTLPAMKETIELLHKETPWCKIVVGGAVLNAEYAKMVGADYYAKDANQGVKIAEQVLG